MPYAHLGEALATGYFLVREQFSDEEWRHFLRTREFVDQEVLPQINEMSRPTLSACIVSVPSKVWIASMCTSPDASALMIGAFR